MGNGDAGRDELVVLTVTAEDVELYADEMEMEELSGNGLVDAVMLQAREYMWHSIDDSDFFGDCIRDAIADVIAWNRKKQPS